MAEIMDAFKVSQQIISKVRRGIAPYWGVATEYNQKLSEMFSRRKIVNIDSRMILEIKKEFVKTNGNIKMTDLAKRLKISSTTVSSILSLREYNEVASSYNGRILSIEKKKAEENAKKRKFENINKKISSENKRNDDLLQKISQLSAKIETNKERILALKSI